MKTSTCLRRSPNPSIGASTDAPHEWHYLLMELRQQQRSRFALSGLFVITFGPCIVGILQMAFWLCRVPGTYFYPVLYFLVTALITLVLYRRLNRACEQYEHTLEQLGKHRDTRLVGPLLKQFSREAPIFSPIIARLLIELLPLLKPDEFELFDKQQRARLYDLLEYPISPCTALPCDEALALAALTALKQVGSKEAIYPVERAAGIDESLKVRDAARMCLPFLQERAEQRLCRQVLLRPADKRDRRTAELLRPHLAAPSTPSKQLLRADMTSHV